MLALHKQFIPLDCREPVIPDSLNWLKFISGCVLFDPPTPMRDVPQGPGLVDFREALDAPRVSLRLLSARGSPVPNTATGPLPFAWVRDARDVQEMQRKRDLLIIAALLERYGVEERRDPEEILDDLLTETPGLADALRTIEDKNPPRLVIDPKPHYSQKEVDRALDIVRATHAKDETPTSGRRSRDPLENAEAAILAKHHGWSYEELADRYEWRYPTHASKVIAAGEAILSKL